LQQKKKVVVRTELNIAKYRSLGKPSFLPYSASFCPMEGTDVSVVVPLASKRTTGNPVGWIGCLATAPSPGPCCFGPFDFHPMLKIENENLDSFHPKSNGKRKN